MVEVKTAITFIVDGEIFAKAVQPTGSEWYLEIQRQAVLSEGELKIIYEAISSANEEATAKL